MTVLDHNQYGAASCYDCILRTRRVPQTIPEDDLITLVCARMSFTTSPTGKRVHHVAAKTESTQNELFK